MNLGAHHTNIGEGEQWCMENGSGQLHLRKIPPRAPQRYGPQRDHPFMSLKNNAVHQVLHVHGPIGGMQYRE